jgi:transcription elongation factor GreA
MNDQRTWLTPAAFEKLSAELDDLKTEGRRRMEARLADARTHGDLRENGDYDAAKNDQGMMEARIRQLEAILANAELREASDDGMVGIGSIVTVVDQSGAEVEYFVATPENKIPGFLIASPSGPLGKALIGTRQGDSITYAAPGGQFTFTIKDVRPFRG